MDDGVGTSGYSKSSASNGYSLDVVDLKWSSAPTQGEWTAGYTVELWVGPLASTRPVSSTGNNNETVALEQANINLHVPVGNGLDLMIGHFNTIVGYESDHHSTNPHFTQSWGLPIEPTHHTGVLGSYKVSDNLKVGLGAANTAFGSAMNAASSEGRDTILAKLDYTLPDSLGPLGGKIHTGRSRNDQVLCDLWLWQRDAARSLAAQLGELLEARAVRELPEPRAASEVLHAAKLAVEAPVTILRVYWIWPGVSAIMNLRFGVAK